MTRGGRREIGDGKPESPVCAHVVLRAPWCATWVAHMSYMHLGVVMGVVRSTGCGLSVCGYGFDQETKPQTKHQTKPTCHLNMLIQGLFKTGLLNPTGRPWAPSGESPLSASSNWLWNIES